MRKRGVRSQEAGVRRLGLVLRLLSFALLLFAVHCSLFTVFGQSRAKLLRAVRTTPFLLTPVFEFTGNESNLSKFSSLENATDVTLIADPTGTAGSTNVISVHFTPSAAGTTTYDRNRSANVTLASSTDHIYIRAKYYMKSPETDGNYGGQRKRFYLTDSGAGNIIHGTLTSDTVGASLPQRAKGYFIYGASQNSYASTSDSAVDYDAWAHLDYEYFTGTPGGNDGWARVWMNGVLDANDLIGINPVVITPPWLGEGWQILKVGRQLDTYNMTPGYPTTAWTNCTVSRVGNVATITVAAGNQTHVSTLANGKDIIVTGFADATFNGVQTVTSMTTSTFVYSNAGGDTTSTGGRVILQGHEYRYWTHIQIYAIPAGMSYANVPSEAELGFR